MTTLEKAIENLCHAISACNELSWFPGQREPYLLEAAKEVIAAYKSMEQPKNEGTLNFAQIQTEIYKLKQKWAESSEAADLHPANLRMEALELSDVGE